MTLDARELTEIPAGEVDEVHALIDELAAAGELRVGAPLAVVALAAAVAVAAAEKHQRPERAAVDERAGFLQGRVKTMIVADTDFRAGLRGGGLDFAELRSVERAGFFDQHVLARADGVKRDGRERAVQRGDDDGVDLRIGEDGLIIGDAFATRRELGEIGGARRIEVARVEHGMGLEAVDAFAADEAATDHREAQRLLLLVSHRGPAFALRECLSSQNSSDVCFVSALSAVSSWRSLWGQIGCSRAGSPQRSRF